VTTAAFVAPTALDDDAPIEMQPLAVERVHEDVVFLEEDTPAMKDELFLPDTLPTPVDPAALLPPWHGVNAQLRVPKARADAARHDEEPGPAPRPASSPASSDAEDTAVEPPEPPPSAPTRQTAVPKPGNPDPPYPSIARRHGWEGVVELELVIDANGRVRAASVVRSSGFDVLDEAACDAGLDWRFEPARTGGNAVESRLRTRVRFVLT